MKNLFLSLRLLFLLGIITGLLYPAAVLLCSRVLYPWQAEGSLLLRDGKVVGSLLLAQKSKSPKYFAARPSACDYATLPSGAGNGAWTSAALEKAITERRAAYPAGTPLSSDLLTCSASGLDPELSPEAVLLQAEGVARARGFDAERGRALLALIHQSVEGSQLSPKRVNILALNLKLDMEFGAP